MSRRTPPNLIDMAQGGQNYRTGRPDAHLVAINAVSPLTKDDQATLMGEALQGLSALMRGDFEGWASVARAANLAECLSDLDLCSDAESRTLIFAAQDAVVAVRERHQQRGTCAMRAEEIKAIREGLDRLEIQLAFATVGELSKAMQRQQQAVSSRGASESPKTVRRC